MDIDIMAVMECTEYVLDKMDMRWALNYVYKLGKKSVKINVWAEFCGLNPIWAEFLGLSPMWAGFLGLNPVWA